MPRMQPLPGDLVQSKIIGVPAAIRQLRRYRDQCAKGAAKGVFIATEFLGRESQKVTPVSEKGGKYGPPGTLKKSMETHYTGSGFDKQGMVSYNTPYAIYVHEDMSKWHASGTYAKFLQRTAWEKRAEISAMISASARAAQHE